MFNYLFSSRSAASSLRHIYDSMCLPYMRNAVLERLAITERSESNPFLTKVAIGYWPDSDVELRVNIYSGKQAQPNIHDHRWPFHSMLLTGSMKHTRYNCKDGAIYKESQEELFAGDIFSMRVEELHTVIASDDLTTLLLRGPVAKESWLQFDLDCRVMRTFTDSSHSREQKVLTKEQVDECLTYVQQRYLAL